MSNACRCVPRAHVASSAGACVRSSRLVRELFSRLQGLRSYSREEASSYYVVRSTSMVIDHVMCNVCALIPGARGERGRQGNAREGLVHFFLSPFFPEGLANFAEKLTPKKILVREAGSKGYTRR